MLFSAGNLDTANYLNLEAKKYWMDMLTPEMRGNLDRMLKEMIKEPKKDGFEYALKLFIGEQFTPLMGDALIAKYKKIFGIKEIDGLSRPLQSAFFEKMMQRIFGRVKSQQEIGNIRLHFYITLSVLEGAAKLSQMMGRKINISVSNIKKISSTSLMEFVEMVNKEVFIVKVELNEFVEGVAYILLFNNGASAIGDMMVSKLQDQSATIGFDQVKISAVQEFMNLLVSSYSDAIANILKGKLFFTIQQIDPFDLAFFINDVKGIIFQKGESSFEKIFTTNISIKIGNYDNAEGLVLIMLEKSSEAMKSVLNKHVSEVEIKISEESELNPEDEAPHPLPKKKRERKNAKIELTMFMDEYFKGRDGNEVVEFLMSQMGIDDLDQLNLGQKEDFANLLLETAFSGISIYRRGIIKSALYDALSIDIGTGAQENESRKIAQTEKKEQKQDKSSNIYKMINKNNEK